MVNLLLLIVGCFRDTSSTILIIAPILLPIAPKLGVDLSSRFITMVVNPEIGMVTPPLCLNLFVVSGFSGMSVLRRAKGALPSATVLLVALLLITYVPEIALSMLSNR